MTVVYKIYLTLPPAATFDAMPTSPPRTRSLSHLAALAATGSLVLLAASGLAADARPPPTRRWPATRLMPRRPGPSLPRCCAYAYAYLTRPGIDSEAILAVRWVTSRRCCL
jgi:hypothetical protein